jgi:threonyl-tRNA synthetase
MIHFALMGSLERFLSVYIEHTAGIFPVWLAPTQITLLPIADRHGDFAQKIAEEMSELGIRVEINTRSETLQSKIREATLQKVPYLGIIGDREIEQKGISLRLRNGEDLGTIPVSDLFQRIKTDIDTKK